MNENSGRVTTQEFYEMQIKTNESISGLKNSIDTYTATTNLRIGELEKDVEQNNKDIKENSKLKKLSNIWDGINTLAVGIGTFLGMKY